MLSLIDSVRAGLSSTSELKRAVVTKRSFTLKIVKDWKLRDVHYAAVNCMDIDPKEHRYLLSGSDDGTISVHDLLYYSGSCRYSAKSSLKSAKVLHLIERSHGELQCLQWYPFDSRLFVSTGLDRKVKLWDSNTMALTFETKLNGMIFHHEVSKVPSQNYLVAATQDKNVILLDLKSGSKSHELSGHSSHVLTCHWSPREEALLATSSSDGQILLWDIRSAKGCLKSLDQHNGKGGAGKFSPSTAHDGGVNGLRFTGNGFFLVSFGVDSKLRVWDVVNGTNLMVNFGTTRNNSEFQVIQMDVTSFDNEHDLVFVPCGSSVIAYEIMTGVKVKELGHSGQFWCCTFEPWYQQLFSGGSKQPILCWASDIHQMRKTLTDKVGRSVSKNKFH
ncbi:DNA excision repair protein ERCC-8-like isoform X2 [Ischnura elegans]|uniref:DNA excision repair protein ERCC-8-like isoform X2 n=1 Tax=Ischnura elegans TaxID=197161 RepID=UPI001ED887B8|nr:DNA excision repair protein ERCC-8-like isoform X2 [Ischnura elegans]